MPSEDEEVKHLLTIARTVVQAGVDQLQKADLSKDDPEIVVAKIYIAMEIAAMLLEQDFANTVYGFTPIDKSKLN